MARYYGLGFDEPIEYSERLVADALKQLPLDWIVLHHVSWQSKRGGKQGDGEADFIVINPRKGLLIIEVKGGGIEVRSGRWFTTNRYGESHPIKNPYDQAVASKHALIAWLNNHSLGNRVRVGHAVVFPNMKDLPQLGPAASPEISLIKSSLSSILDSINRCFDHWGLITNLSEDELERLIALLAPTVSVAQSILGQSVDAEAKILTLTAEQVEIFAGLRANRGGLILGRAGTGKTILALARAQQLARDGFNTLLVCYNELLANDLSERLKDKPNLMATTFHSMCIREANRAKLQIPSVKSKTWWEQEAPGLFVQASRINDTEYDAVIVDEGQDFSPLWLDALRSILSGGDEGPFFIFADPLQDLWSRDWQHGVVSSFSWELTQNLRNTQPIADRVAACVNIACKGTGVVGPNPSWSRVVDDVKESDVISIIEMLLQEGMNPSDLVVLCESASLVSRLRDYTVAGCCISKWGSNGIAVESIARFKGLESPVVILALSSKVHKEIGPIMPYVGMSRARSVLFVIGTDEEKKRINWAHDLQ